MDNKNYLECGKIVNTHGVKGALKIEPWCDSAEDFTCLERVFFVECGLMKEMKVKRSSIFKQFVIAEIEGVNDFDSALALKNQIIYASRDDFSLEEGDYFIADLIGLDIVDAVSGEKYGKLKDVINRGASDIYVIETENGERMMPAVEEFVREINLGKGIFVSPIEGMFD